MIMSRASQYRDSKRNETLCLWFNDKVFVECIGVIMGIPVLLMIIDRRVSIMSGVFPNRRVTHLRA